MMRIGHGYDVHKLVEGRKLVLGGVEIPHSLGLLGHSDADVLTHAVMDALLGAAALGDIGQHFPDTDDRFLGIDSQKLLMEVCRMIRDAGYEISNLDATVIAQKPKLMAYLPQMRETLAATMGIPLGRLNLKATTE
jgi:2-C-methyl-D-erythritol 2,4-cyclodiphosphate synthase